MTKKTGSKNKSTNSKPTATDPEEQLEQLVVESMAAWEAEDFEKALRLGDQACGLAPDAAVAHHCRAAALAELGRLEEAQEACDRGLELAPDDPDALTYACDFYISCMGDEERALELAERGLKAARAEDDEELEVECLLLRGRAEERGGQLIEALKSVEEALEHLGDEPEAMLERGVLLFELCRFDDARAQLEAVLKVDAELAAAHHYLGLLDERQGEREQAEQRLARARKLDPDEFPEPVEVPPAEFDRVLEQAMEHLPPKVREYLRNVAITVEELPTDEDLRASDPPLSPLVLGMFRGNALGEQQLLEPWSHFPSSIVLYQKNLERSVDDRDELVEQIAITLLHEVGHFLGLDEHDLRDRGLD